MARIEDFKFEDKQFKIQEPAETSYSVRVLNGQTYFQINMYGSPKKNLRGLSAKLSN